MNSDAKEKTRIQRFLYGYRDHSNRGTHIYQRKGIMDKLMCKNIDNRVILVLEKDSAEIVSVLEGSGAKLEIIPVDVNKEFLE